MDLKALIPVGTTGTKSQVVTRELTVAHFHPEMPAVYGTPMMIYLMEVAAGEAIHPLLPDGWGSVGAEMNVRHLAATPVGFTVTATARVVEVTDKRVVFEVVAHDGVETIGEGTHVRVPVDYARFNRSMAKKSRA
jgi:predicted thioesterase